MFVYFILDEKSNAVKIGKANNIASRLSELQTGNPNKLKLIDYVACVNEKESLLLESVLHDKYAKHHRRGEWFDYDKRLFTNNILNEETFKLKQTRSSLIFQTLFGTEEKFNVNNAPRCYFYPNLSAHIMDRYEKSVNKKVPFRTMAWPTYGKSMLLPYSDKKDRVFISCKKHEQNLEEKKFKNPKEQIASLNDFLTYK